PGRPERTATCPRRSRGYYAAQPRASAGGADQRQFDPWGRRTRRPSRKPAEDPGTRRVSNRSSPETVVAELIGFCRLSYCHFTISEKVYSLRSESAQGNGWGPNEETGRGALLPVSSFSSHLTVRVNQPGGRRPRRSAA